MLFYAAVFQSTTARCRWYSSPSARIPLTFASMRACVARFAVFVLTYACSRLTRVPVHPDHQLLLAHLRHLLSTTMVIFCSVSSVPAIHFLFLLTPVQTVLCWPDCRDALAAVIEVVEGHVIAISHRSLDKLPRSNRHETEPCIDLSLPQISGRAPHYCILLARVGDVHLP